MSEAAEGDCDLCPLESYAVCSCGAVLCNHHWHQHRCAEEDDGEPLSIGYNFVSNNADDH